MAHVDVVVVGGGVGGSSLAANLAAAGLAVTVPEREARFVDRVRGEWITPWGVAECERLGIAETLRATRANPIARFVGYDECIAPMQAEATALAYDAVAPGLPAPLCIEHVAMQNALLGHAQACGARVLRGTVDLRVAVGLRPRVTFAHAGEHHELRPRLVVGADGRSSSVRRQLGLVLDEDPVDHLMSGLLVDQAEAWAHDTVALGKAGEVAYFVFPQGAGRVRVYVDYDITNRGRYTGDAGARRLLEALDHAALPDHRPFRSARPIGPCHAFPSQDSSLDTPGVEGAILIGDAAGYSDPIWGQGLSATFRDARQVRDAMLGRGDWSLETFRPWMDDRRERSRRLRWETRFATTLYARFDTDALTTRARALERLAARPELGGYLGAGMAGPENVPPEVFTQTYFDALFAP